MQINFVFKDRPYRFPRAILIGSRARLARLGLNDYAR